MEHKEDETHHLLRSLDTNTDSVLFPFLSDEANKCLVTERQRGWIHHDTVFPWLIHAFLLSASISLYLAAFFKASGSYVKHRKSLLN